MSAVETAPAPSLTVALQSLLRSFPPAGGDVVLDARSRDGIGRERHRVPPPVREVPMKVLDFIERNWGLTFSPALRQLDNMPSALAFAFAEFPILLDFNRETSWTYRQNAGSLETIGAALRDAAPPPTFLIDGFARLVALWTLSEPVPLPQEQARAIALQRALAQRLGADVKIGEDLGALIPLPGGIVRGEDGEGAVVRFVLVAPERRYHLHDLEAAGAGDGAPRRKGEAR